MKSARPTTSQMCFAFSKYGILDFGYSKHLSEILFWLFQTFIRDLVLSVPKIRIIDLRIIFANTEILDICFSKTLELWILAFPILEFWILAFQTLEFTVLVFSKHQNSVFWLFQTLKFSILAFPPHEFLDFVFF